MLVALEAGSQRRAEQLCSTAARPRDYLMAHAEDVTLEAETESGQGMSQAKP